MKKEKINTLNERDLLIGLITSDNFCKEIAPILEPRLLQIDYARIISKWIKDYYENFSLAPKRDIVKLYRGHMDELNDDALQENCLAFIEKIINDYEALKTFNAEYAIQQAIKYLKTLSLKSFSDTIDSFVTLGDIDKAESLITKYRKVEKQSGDHVSLLDDQDIVLDAFTEEQDKLFSFKGAFGKLVGDIHREDFVAFLASMKAGKTFQLIDCGIEALKNGLTVVMFSLEMSRTAMIKRTWRALTGQVLEDVDLHIPYFNLINDDKYEIAFKDIHKKASTLLEVDECQARLKRMFRGGSLYIYAEPAYSLTVEGLEIKLDDLAHDGVMPDVIIIDYADILMPSEKGELRNQLDGIWKRLRALAQKRKAVVFTASQTNRGAIGREVEATDIAEDIRKLAHVTSMISISKTQFCKENNLAIYSQLAVREGECELRKVVATQCLTLGRPVISSEWKDNVIFKDDAETGNTSDDADNGYIKRHRK